MRGKIEPFFLESIINEMNRFPYGVQFLDDLHNYFPAILYDDGSEIHTVQDLLSYIRTQTMNLNPYEVGLRDYRTQRTQQNINQIYQTSNRIPRANPLISTRRPIRAAAQSVNQEIPQLIPPSPPSSRTRASRLSSTASASHAASGATATATASTHLPPSEVPSLVPDYTDYTLYYDILPRTNNLITNRSTQLIDNSILRAVIGLMNLSELEPVVVRATQQQLDTKTTLSAARPSDESENCSICQEHYTEGQALRGITFCTHKFHKDCVDRWFETNVHCPICRHDIRQ